MADLRKPALDIGVIVQDIAAMRRFYEQGLGPRYLGEAPTPVGGVHFFAVGQSLLKLYAIDGVAARPDAAFGSQTGLAYFTLDVVDLDAALKHCAAAGIQPTTPATDFDTGADLPEPAGRVRVRFAMLADPEGNTVELIQRV